MKAKSPLIVLFFLLYYSCSMVTTMATEPLFASNNGKGVFSSDGIGKCYVLLVGVDYYESFTPLNYCAADMESMQECFLKMGIPQENIILLADSPGIRKQARPLTIHSPTRKNITEALDRILKKIRENDVLFIAFSGHGVRLDIKNDSGKPEKMSCFCPRDAKYRCERPEETMIPVPWLYKKLEHSPAKFKMLLVDSCRNSVSDLGERALTSKAIGQFDQLSLSTDLPKATIVLVSCKSGQKSYEDPEIQHGLFSYYFTKGLAGAADTDKGHGNLDGKVMYHELVGYLNHYTTAHANMMKCKIPQNPDELAGGQEFDDFVLTAVQRPVVGEPPEYYTNAIGMKFKKVPAGSIRIKDAEGNMRTLQASDDFLLGRFEVTQQQYAIITGKNPSGFVNEDSRVSAPWPVDSITWQDAKDYVDKLNETLPMRAQIEFGDGWEYSLPMSTDWEYAFFSGIAPDSKDVRNCAPLLENLDVYAWFDKNSDKKTHPVGNKKPISGFYDMLGNVAEWCAEDYVVQVGENNNTTKILKGGNWNQSFSPQYVFNPAYVLPATPNGNGERLTGFRIAIKKKALPPPATATPPDTVTATPPTTEVSPDAATVADAAIPFAQLLNRTLSDNLNRDIQSPGRNPYYRTPARHKDSVHKPSDSGSVQTAPNATVPNATVPNATVPNATVPNATVPNATAPNATVPNATVPNAVDPNAVDPNATMDATVTSEVVEQPVATGALAPIPYAIFNESNDYPLRIYRKNPIVEDCDVTTDVITLLPRGTYSFGKPDENVSDIYIQTTSNNWKRFKLHPTKIISFSYNAEKFQWYAAYTTTD